MASTTVKEGLVLSANALPDPRQPSPNRMTLAFSSNNPFRNRAASPSPHSSIAAAGPSASSPAAAAATFPGVMPSPPGASASFSSASSSSKPQIMSRNPFLDASEITASPGAADGAAARGRTAAAGSQGARLTEDIFQDLSLLDTPADVGPPPPYRSGPMQRSGTLPPPSSHRPSGSDERRDRHGRPHRGPGSPSKREHRPRPRGMSDTSLLEDRERRDRRERDRLHGDRLERTESEERRRRERRREREERHRREKEKVRNGDRPTKKPQGLDIIDKLDVTGIYGQGLFHHDGPFDACNPHRNKAKSRRPAPMEAFPADSMNMALGGAGPLRSRLDLDKFHGRGAEGFSEFAATRKADTAIFNPTERSEQVHGDESYGLGTSTFLEGAPVSKSALQRRESEDQTGPTAENGFGAGGLSRKKSLAQRLRGMSGSRRPGGDGHVRSPEARYGGGGESFDASPPRSGQRAASAGGLARARYSRENETNPFDREYDSAFDRKTAQIRMAEQNGGRPRTPSSPKGGASVGLVRSMTSDGPAAARGSSNEEDRPSASTGGGLMNRMRSLRGGRRSRPERRDA